MSSRTHHIIPIVLLALFFAACSPSSKNLFPLSGDVGPVAIPGSASFEASSGTYTLTGSGTNMWGPSDEFFMTWQEVSGNFSLSADVAFEGVGVNAHRKLGLIVRDGLGSEAVYADVAVHGDGLVSLQYRSTPGGETQEVVASPSGSPLPSHISLSRSGNTLTISSDARTSTATVSLPDDCFVGLFICSHDPAVSETARFWNVKLK